MSRKCQCDLCKEMREYRKSQFWDKAAGPIVIAIWLLGTALVTWLRRLSHE